MEPGNRTKRRKKSRQLVVGGVLIPRKLSLHQKQLMVLMVTKRVFDPGDRNPAIPSRLLALEDAVFAHLASFLPRASARQLALTCRQMRVKLGFPSGPPVNTRILNYTLDEILDDLRKTACVLHTPRNCVRSSTHPRHHE